MKPDTYQWAVEQGPIGVWQTNSGSATVLMSNVLTLSPDGTGTVAYYATLTDDAEFPLFWRFDQPGELRLFQIDEDYPAPQKDDDWEVFRYRADWREFDIGAGPVLVNDGIENDSGAYPINGFWVFDSPIELIQGPQIK